MMRTSGYLASLAPASAVTKVGTFATPNCNLLTTIVGNHPATSHDVRGVTMKYALECRAVASDGYLLAKVGSATFSVGVTTTGTRGIATNATAASSRRNANHNSAA